MTFGNLPAHTEIKRRQEPALGGTWNPSSWETLKTLLQAAGEVPAPFAGVQDPSGFKTISDVATRQAVQQAQAGDLTARNAIIENRMPLIQNLMRRTRPAEGRGPGTAPRVSAQDLSQEFVATDLPGVIAHYDPTSPKGLDAAIRSRAKHSVRAAREMEATVPKPGEGDIYNMSVKIAKAQDEFRTQFGKDPSDIWLARKFNMTRPAMRDALEQKDRTQRFGSVSFDTIDRTGHSLSERISAESGLIPSAMQSIESEASNSPNLAAATKFMDQLDPIRKSILTKMMESKPTRQIADELKSEGQSVSHMTVNRYQRELMKQLKDIRENRGFLGKMSGREGGAAPRAGESVSETGMPIPQSVVDKTVARSGKLPNQDVERSGAVKQAESMGLKGDAAEAEINRQMGISGGSDAPPPVEYRGFQQGYGDMPGFHLYNLTDDIVDEAGKILHPKGSTISAETLRKYGINVPPPISGGATGDDASKIFDMLGHVQSRMGGYRDPQGFAGPNRPPIDMGTYVTDFAREPSRVGPLLNRDALARYLLDQQR